jgi:hypothetical protein
MSAAERSEADGLDREVPQAQQTVVAPRTLEAHVRSLQRSAGNRAIGDLVRSGRLGSGLARTPTRVSFNISEPRVGGGTYGTHAGFDVDIDGIEIIVTQKVRLIPDSDVTAAELTAVQSAAETAFVSMWDSRFIFDDAARREHLFLRVRVQWVTSGARTTRCGCTRARAGWIRGAG